jgi:hypothetical protein
MTCVRALLITVVMVLLPASAFAANRVWVSEFAALPSSSNGQLMQISGLPSIANQQVDITSGAQTVTLQGNTKFVRLVCEAQCAVKGGSTAAATDTVLPAYSPEYFGVVAGGATLTFILAP